MYEIWHSRTNNMIDWFETAVEAEAVILEAVRDQGQDVLSDTYMVEVDVLGEAFPVADGEAILVAVKRLAAAERAVTIPSHRKVG